MASPVQTPNIKKHKRHKSERKERLDSPADKPAGLKLILKVGSQGTPEHNTDWNYQSGPSAQSYSVQGNEDAQIATDPNLFSMSRSHHKKSKKKKKKKDKGKDRERKHRHHHKDKKRKRDESGVDETPPIGIQNVFSLNLKRKGFFNSYYSVWFVII